MAKEVIMKENNIPLMFQRRVVKYGARTCVMYKKDGVYTGISWNQMNGMVRDLAGYLLSLGIRSRDRVAIFAENRFEWWVADMATLSIGAITVPIYATTRRGVAVYPEDSESRLCFVSTRGPSGEDPEGKKKLPGLKISSYRRVQRKKTGVMTFSKALEGEEIQEQGPH
jgi:long-chain acyl-CoA synthetase